MLRLRPQVVCTVLSAVALAIPLTAEVALVHPDQQRFTARADLVRLEVVVTDRNGTPVRNLSKDDFIVYDHGEERTIELFQAISAPDAAPAPLVAARVDVADNRSPELSQLVLLVIDDMVIRPYLERTRALAMEVVKRVGSSSTIGVILTSGTDGVEPTGDLKLVLEVIGRVGTPASKAPRIPDLAGNQVSKPTLAEAHSGDPSGCHFTALRQIAEMAAADERARKALVYISPFCGSEVRDDVTRSPGSQYGRYLDWLDAFHKINMPFYALDPRGVLAPSASQFPVTEITGERSAPITALSRSANPVYLSQEGLRNLAEATGGVAITNSDAYDDGLSALESGLRTYYVIGIAPHNPERRQFHPVDVRVRGTGLTARLPPGYLAPGSSGAKPSSIDELTALTVGSLPAGDLPLRLVAVVEPSSLNTKHILALVEVDLQDRAGPDITSDRLAGVLTAIDATSQKVSQRIKFERLVSLPQLGSSSSRAYMAAVAVDVKPDLYQLRLAARSERGGTGSVYLMVDARSERNDNVILGSIVVGTAPPEPRVNIAGPPNRKMTLPFRPTLNRSFSRADRLLIYCPLVSRAGAPPVKVLVELLDAKRATVRRFEPTLSTSQSVKSVNVNLDLATVPAGHYSIRVLATSGRSSADQELRVEVRGSGQTGTCCDRIRPLHVPPPG